MGMYTGIRFKGYIKPEFRKIFKPIALEGKWDGSHVELFRAYGTSCARASFIPCESLSYMPECWETVLNGETVDADGFERTYNEETGYWTFQCSLKNYENEIEIFFSILPLFVESVDHLEYFYEEWASSQRYDIVNGKVELVERDFIEYES